MKKGMIFDLYQENKPTRRVMSINENDVICLDELEFKGEIIKNIDFENQVREILIGNILYYPYSNY
jgi:hypothetical protein